jgi:hypothetical protein
MIGSRLAIGGWREPLHGHSQPLRSQDERRPGANRHPNGKDKITNGLAYAIKKYKRKHEKRGSGTTLQAMRCNLQEFLRQNPTRRSLSEERYKDDVKFCAPKV